MDLRICFLCKPYRWDNRCSERIQVYIPCKGLLDILVGKCKFHRCTERLDHKAMGCKDRFQQVLEVEVVLESST